MRKIYINYNELECVKMAVMKITEREWTRMGKDYKGITNGQMSMLYYDPRCGTCSIPVEIDNEYGMEYGKYTYRSGCNIYSVYAYSMAEALRIIRHNNNYFGDLRDLRREKPYACEERARIISGHSVYVYGGYYEITDTDGMSVIHSGFCESGLTPRDVYGLHYPAHPKNGVLVEDATLFFNERGLRFYGTIVQSATLEIDEHFPMVDGYTLKYTLHGSDHISVARWNERPRVIAADGVILLPDSIRLPDPVRFRGKGEDYLKVITQRLDDGNVAWWEL